MLDVETRDLGQYAITWMASRYASPAAPSATSGATGDRRYRPRITATTRIAAISTQTSPSSIASDWATDPGRNPVAAAGAPGTETMRA